MKAAFIRETGPAHNIIYSDFPSPVVGARQCLIQVLAVSVNPIDTYLRAGIVRMKLPLPYVIGCDLAGIALEIGAEVRRFKPGERVWGSNQGLLGRQGTFAEFAAVDEDWLYPTPPEVSDQTAAACALVAITAHLGLVRDAKLQPGETLFVNGGSGGVGSMVVQIAKALGARVITTAGSETKVAICRELGADEVINYRTASIGEAIKAVVPEGVNVWWETLREPDFDQAVAALASRGRMIIMAGREARPQFPVGPFYVKGCSLHGFAMFNATPDEQRRCANDINRWLANGRLKPRIDRILPLSQAAEAHRLQEENTLEKKGTLAGKIVLTP